MNTKSVRTMITVVGLTVSFAAASFAQDTLKAVVGFPFVAQGTKLAAGTYTISPIKVSGGSVVYTVRNIATNRAIIVSSQVSAMARSTDSRAPKLSFLCAEGEYCALKQVSDGTGRINEIAIPGKRGVSNEASVTEIALTRR